jgi:hypothetical protein
MNISSDIAQIWTNATCTRMTRLIKLTIRLYFGSLERNSNPFIGFNNGAGVVTALPPLLTWAIQMPCTRHSHMRVQNNTIVEHNFNVFAVRINAFNSRARANCGTDESRRFKSGDSTTH